MEFDKDELLIESFSNSLSSRASLFAIRDVLLQTEEQKIFYKSKYKEHMEKFLIEFTENFKIENPEKFLEGFIKANQQ